MKLTQLSRGFLSMTLGLATVLGGASAAKADLPDSPGDVPRSTLAPADYKVVKCLHGMNEMGVSAGELAQKNAGTQAVRTFGATLVSDHKAADQQLLAYAKKAGIDPKVMKGEAAPNDTTRRRQSLDRLRTLTGQSFDRQFALTVRDEHARAIALIENARPEISDPNLGALLDQQLPTLKSHYDVAANLTAQAGAASSEGQGQPNTTSTGQTQQPPR